MIRLSGLSTRRVLLRTLLCAGTALGLPALAAAQTFVPAGPGVETGPYQLMNGADLPAPGQSTKVPPQSATQSGAIQALAFDPKNYNILLAASPNGGIFRSTNGGQSWTATTDNQASLSIASLNFDLSDPTGNHVIAGVGDTSSGSTFQFNPYFNRARGGLTNGLLLSSDGGATWSGITSNLPSINYQGVSIRGNVIMAAAFNEAGSWASGTGVESGSGLYRSTDGGKTFSLVSNGLPPGAATALVGDPNNPNRFYVAITTASAGNRNDAGTSLYTTTDGGATWSKVFDASQSGGKINSRDPTAMRLATGPNGSVAIALIDGVTGTITGVYLSQNNGSNWKDLSVALTPGKANGTGGVSQGEGDEAQGAGHQVEVPNNPFTQVVADAGDIANLALNPGGQAAFHSVISIDPNNPNVVYVAGDRQDRPNSTGAATYSGAALRAVLNSDGTVTYSAITDNFTGDHSTYHPDTRAMAFDASGNLVVGSDGGVYVRSNPQSNQGVWRGLNIGRQALEVYDLSLDPHSGLLAVAAQDNGTAIQSPTNRSVYRQVAGGDGSIAVTNGITDPKSSWTYVACQYLCGGPTRIQTDLQGNFTSADQVDVYYSVDGTPNGIIGIDSSNVLFTPKLKLNNIDPTFMALGVQPGVIMAQDNVLAPSTKYSTNPLFGYNGPGSYVILKLQFAGRTGFNASLDFGTRDNEFALLAGGSAYNGYRLFVSTATSYNNVSLRPVTSYTGFAPVAVLFDPRAQSRFFATDTNILYGTVNGGLTGTDLTAKLPADFIRPDSLAFISNNGVNALLVGGMNDAANAGSPLVVADSNASGVLSNWRRFGTGLPNALVDVLDYVPSLDTLAVGTYGRGAFLLYDVTSNFASATVLQFGLANNDSTPDASILTGNRPLIKYGTGTLLISGAATYTGGTDIKSGQFVLNGSILNDALIEASASMFGAGSVGGKLTVNGTLTPGILGVGPLSAGSFAAGPNSVMQVFFDGSQANLLKVSGAATISGMSLKPSALAGAGAMFDQRYAILTSSALTGQFSNYGTFTPDLGNPNLLDRVRYDLLSNGAVLEVVNPVNFAANATNPNQRAVGSAINASINTASDAFLLGLNGVFNGGSPAAASLSALSGEGALNEVQGARVVGEQFMRAVASHVAGLGTEESSTIQLARNSLNSMPGASRAISDITERATLAEGGSGSLETSAVWGEVFTGSDRLRGYYGDDVRSRATGFAVGFERRLAPDFKVGGSLGYADARSNTASLATRSDGDYYNGSLYFGRKVGPWFFGGVASYSSGKIDESRTIALTGGPTYQARGTPRDSDFQASLLGGRTLLVNNGTRLTGSASFTYEEVSQKRFTETGADPFSLHYEGVKLGHAITEVGLRLDHTFHVAGGAVWDPYAGVGGVLLSGDRSPVATLNFVGAPITQFQIVGARLPGSWVDLKAGVTYRPNARWKLDLRYQGAYGDRLKDDAALAHIAFSW